MCGDAVVADGYGGSRWREVREWWPTTAMVMVGEEGN